MQKNVLQAVRKNEKEWGSVILTAKHVCRDSFSNAGDKSKISEQHDRSKTNSRNSAEKMVYKQCDENEINCTAAILIMKHICHDNFGNAGDKNKTQNQQDHFKSISLTVIEKYTVNWAKKMNKILVVKHVCNNDINRADKIELRSKSSFKTNNDHSSLSNDTIIGNANCIWDYT